MVIFHSTWLHRMPDCTPTAVVIFHSTWLHRVARLYSYCRGNLPQYLVIEGATQSCLITTHCQWWGIHPLEPVTAEVDLCLGRVWATINQGNKRQLTGELSSWCNVDGAAAQGNWPVMTLLPAARGGPLTPLLGDN